MVTLPFEREQKSWLTMQQCSSFLLSNFGKPTQACTTFPSFPHRNSSCGLLLLWPTYLKVQHIVHSEILFCVSLVVMSGCLSGCCLPLSLSSLAILLRGFLTQRTAALWISFRPLSLPGKSWPQQPCHIQFDLNRICLHFDTQFQLQVILTMSTRLNAPVSVMW